MNISLSEVLTAQISRNELNLDYGRIISSGSINSRIPQELVKWFLSAKNNYFPYLYLNFIFNIFYFISVHNAF